MQRLSRFLLAIFVAGLLGVAAELFLVGQAHGWRQILPVGLVTTSLVSVAWQVWCPAGPARWVLIIVLSLMELGGIVGSILHYWANVTVWSRHGRLDVDLELLRRSVFGPAPILAPCSLALIALIGFAYVMARWIDLCTNGRDPIV